MALLALVGELPGKDVAVGLSQTPAPKAASAPSPTRPMAGAGDSVSDEGHVTRFTPWVRPQPHLVAV
ncbi:hypothetical protein ACFCZ1_03320 [Streptomyces sp. NPDC056224]|uniref:hypothetical protein n=1 Tax=Streptomyces sp. NPDC056224 TaxID=3345750 RepID=UPI0035D6D6A0